MKIFLIVPKRHSFNVFGGIFLCFSSNLFNFTCISNIFRTGTPHVSQLRLANTSLLVPKWFEIESFFHLSSRALTHLPPLQEICYYLVQLTLPHQLWQEDKVSSSIVHVISQEILSERNVNMNYFFKTSCHSEKTFQELKILLSRVEERL